MITNIKMNNYDLMRDFNMYCISKNINSPSAKTQYVDVPGMNGSYDLTDFFGQVNYDNRIIKFDFVFFDVKNPLEHYSKIKNALHGEKMKIRINNDIHYYYFGRIDVGDLTNDKNIYKVSISCNCDPFKYKRYKTVMSYDVDGFMQILCVNEKMPTVPTIITDGNVRLEFNNQVYNLNEGSYIIDGFKFVEGHNLIKATGNCHLTFEYQEGSL